MTMHTKRQENKTHNQEKNQSIETNPEMRDDKNHKDLKTGITNLISKPKDMKESSM